jgi:hypothetical protein
LLLLPLVGVVFLLLPIFACSGGVELPDVGLSYLLLLVLDLPLLVAASLLPPAYSFLPKRLHSRSLSTEDHSTFACACSWLASENTPD